MGMADLVPGVSGGTMALLLGIYARLLKSLSGFTLIEYKLFFSKNFFIAFSKAWQKIDGFFLLALGIGILTSVFLFATGLKWLLTNKEVPLMAFFFGLMLSTLFVLLRGINLSSATSWVNLLIGIVFAAGLTYLPISLNSNNLFNFYLAGLFASCFMLLPGVSGSFLLLLLGIYAPVIDAIHFFNFKILTILALGILTGLLFFSRLLNRLLEKYTNATMSLLVGFIGGSLINLWPWQMVKKYSLIDEKMQVITKEIISPDAYLAIYGDNFLIYALVFFTLGFLLTFYLNYLGKSNLNKN